MKADDGRILDGKARRRLFWTLCLLAGVGLTTSAFLYERYETTAHTNEATPSQPTYRIPEHGRLRLALADLPPSGSIRLELTLTESPDASGTRSVLVVSTDGRRLDLPARRIEGTSSVLQLEIERSYLSRGLYLIQLEAEDDHPLHLRRYVLAIH